MAIIYSATAIGYRLSGVVAAIDSGPGPGVLQLLDGATILATFTFQTPSGTVAGNVLTFTMPIADQAAAVNGNANLARIENSTGTVMISGLTVGIPLSGADIIINNGFNTTQVTIGRTISMVSGQIIGS